jgi:hypothetical protein
MPVPRCFSRARDIGAEKSSGSLPYCSWRLGTMDREQWIIRNGRPIVALCVKNSPALLPYYLVLDATGSRPENSRNRRVPSEDPKSGGKDWSTLTPCVHEPFGVSSATRTKVLPQERPNSSFAVSCPAVSATAATCTPKPATIWM